MERDIVMQCGFFFDQSRCSGCRACTLACKTWHNLPAGPLKYLKIYEYEKGDFPAVRIHYQWIPCYHCEEPACISNCPSGAIYKEKKYGAVLIESNKCSRCRLCYKSCPYGAPVFESEKKQTIVRKCTMCIDRLEVGLKPICVLACPNRSLDFGPLDKLKSRYGDNADLEDLPPSRITKPAAVFKPHSQKRQLVPYNAARAMELLMRRDPLPRVWQPLENATGMFEGIVGRDKLIIKHKTAENLMHYSRSDEG
jgi:anaerobic dimethyl sulfoxide reductase subunit B